MSTRDGEDGRVALLAALVDDAALFPPASLDLGAAVAEHRRHRDSEHAWMVGRFVCPASRLPELRVALPEDETLDVSVVLDGQDGDTLQADLDGIGAADGAGGVVVSALEVRLTGKDPVDYMSALVGAVTRAGLAGKVHLYAEVPIAGRSPQEVGRGIAAVAAAQRRLTDVGRSTTRTVGGRAARPAPDLGLPSYATRSPHAVPEPAGVTEVHPADPGRLLGAKVRCGGDVSDAVPSAGELTAFLVACQRAHVPWKATAGLHHPLRYQREDGVWEHGFLNLAAAAALTYEGQAAPGDLAGVLEEREALSLGPDGLTVRDRVLGPPLLTAVRRNAFLSVGSCSIDEPVEDLAALGVLTSEGALA